MLMLQKRAKYCILSGVLMGKGTKKSSQEMLESVGNRGFGIGGL